MESSDTTKAAPPALWPLTCRCGEKWSASEWRELPASGRYDAGRDGWLELRTCVCGATLSVPCDPPESETR